MAGRRPPRPPVMAPDNAKEGAERVNALLVTLFDRRNGKGADWLLMLESLFRAGFQITDEQQDDEARRSIMRRVHADAEVRMTGGYADGHGAGKPEPGGAGIAPSHTAEPHAPGPRPPK